MLLLLLSYLAGVLTIISPCILPVLPFVFARAGQPFMRSGLPLLLGMAVTFAGVATLAAVGGGWAVQANSFGRAVALLILGLFGLLLLFGMTFPNRMIMLIFPPIPMKAKYMVIIFGALELYLGVSGNAPGIANFAHLGGMLFGFVLIYRWQNAGKR